MGQERQTAQLGNIEIWGREVNSMVEAGEVFALAHISKDADRETKIKVFVKEDPVLGFDFAFTILRTVAAKYSDYDHISPEWNFFENADDELTDELVAMMIERMDRAVETNKDAEVLMEMALKSGELVSATMDGETLLYFAQEHLTATNAREERTERKVQEIVDCMKRCQVNGISFWDFCAEADQA